MQMDKIYMRFLIFLSICCLPSSMLAQESQKARIYKNGEMVAEIAFDSIAINVRDTPTPPSTKGHTYVQVNNEVYCDGQKMTLRMPGSDEDYAVNRILYKDGSLYACRFHVEWTGGIYRYDVILWKDCEYLFSYELEEPFWTPTNFEIDGNDIYVYGMGTRELADGSMYSLAFLTKNGTSTSTYYETTLYGFYSNQGTQYKIYPYEYYPTDHSTNMKLQKTTVIRLDINDEPMELQGRDGSKMHYVTDTKLHDGTPYVSGYTITYTTPANICQGWIACSITQYMQPEGITNIHSFDIDREGNYWAFCTRSTENGGSEYSIIKNGVLQYDFPQFDIPENVLFSPENTKVSVAGNDIYVYGSMGGYDENGEYHLYGFLVKNGKAEWGPVMDKVINNIIYTSEE